MEELKKRFATYDEIAGQGRKLSETLSRLADVPIPLSKGSRYLLTGCGSSLYISLFLTESWRGRLGLDVRSAPSSELILYPERILKREEKPILIAISRSGETTETIKAARIARQRFDCRIVTVSCDSRSTLAGLGDTAIHFDELREQSVVMTRAFTGMLGAFLAWSGLRESIQRLPDWLGTALKENEKPLQELAGSDQKNLVFLGTGPFFPLACEAMLKVKEMTGAVVEAWQTFEFRHGPRAILQEGSLVWIFAGAADFPHLSEVISEFQELGARVCLAGNRLPEKLAGSADLSFSFDWDVDEPEVEACGMLHLPQYLAFFKAIALNKNPDHPEKLSRVVTLGEGSSERI